MKIKSHIFQFFIAILAIVSITSCSQDHDLLPSKKIFDARNFQSTSKMAVTTGNEVDESTGAVHLTILPEEAKAKVYIFNNNYTSDSYSAVDGDNGQIMINGVPPGIYTIAITPHNQNFKEAEIINVQIDANTVTELGQIDL